MSDFLIQDAEHIPAARSATPTYNIPFGQMKAGQMLRIPSDKVPVQHARAELMRFQRNNPLSVFVTRTEKDGSALVVYRHPDTTQAELDARVKRSRGPRKPKAGAPVQAPIASGAAKGKR